MVSGEPLLYLEFNKPNQQNVLRLIYLKKLSFPSVKTTVDTLIDVRLGMKHQNIKYITLLSDANVPVRLRAQQRDKYS